MLNKIIENTYYIDFPSKVGLYILKDNEVCLIDTGNNKDAGKKISKILDENNFKLKFIINTHSHADHIGGNNYLQKKYNVPIYSYGEETAFINNTILEPAALYGANPLQVLKSHFLLAESSQSKLWNEEICTDIEVIELFGHSLSMIGILTKDNVLFLGDALASEYVIDKYKIFYIYDIERYIKTLDLLSTFNYKKYILSHGEISDDISSLIIKNKNVIENIKNDILDICKEKQTYEEILKKIFEYYNLNMNITQYYLIGTTIKSFITYLTNNNLLDLEIENNKLFYKSI